MGGSWQKGTGNDTTVLGSINEFQYFKRKDKRWSTERIG
jgi:hypothetical protein